MSSLNAEAIWCAARETLRGMLKPEIFTLWFAPLRARAAVGDRLVLEVADEFCEVWELNFAMTRPIYRGPTHPLPDVGKPTARSAFDPFYMK